MNSLGDICGFDVSRETLERLEIYQRLLKQWNPKINLVAPSTLESSWERHIRDSAQVFQYAEKGTSRWLDIGSGGGFPGLVVAILGREANPEMSVTLLESDLRKSTFLRTVMRQTEVKGTVLSERIEGAPRQDADVVSARALAPLPKLLGYVHRHIADNGKALLMKGVNWKKEVETASESWNFALEVHNSVTESEAVILEVGELAHV